MNRYKYVSNSNKIERSLILAVGSRIKFNDIYLEKFPSHKDYRGVIITPSPETDHIASILGLDGVKIRWDGSDSFSTEHRRNIIHE